MSAGYLFKSHLDKILKQLLFRKLIVTTSIPFVTEKKILKRDKKLITF